jgi:GntP family gluconate:H+ symporter
MWLFLLLILSIVFIIVTTSVLKWHPFLSLLAAALGFGIFSGTMSLNEVVISINTGFGNTIGFIGIVILAGSIIGKFLEMSGGANRLAAGTLKVVGKNNVPLAMSILGWIVSIPVFCDSAFIILSPLARALSRQVKATLAIAAMALSLGLILTHSIIPPTPGPVGAAAILGADLGLTILLGIPVSIVGLAGAWFFAVKIASRCEIDPGPGEPVTSSPEFMPSLFKSILPVFLPILLIILRSISELPSQPFGEGIIFTGVNFIGQPVIALLIGVLLAFLLPEKLTANMISSSGWVGQAILGAAGIIIITASGGAFGKVLQDSGISDVIKNNVVGVKSLSIFLPVIIASALKIAQGSGTVAIITTASLMAPLIGTLGMDSAPARALLVVAIGAGSTIASHANDSYFWVVTQMSGMNVKQGYKLQTRGTFFVGVCSSLAAWILSLFIL